MRDEEEGGMVGTWGIIIGIVSNRGKSTTNDITYIQGTWYNAPIV